MPRIALVLAALVLAAGAGTANAAPSPQQQIAKLTSQVTALQKTVTSLQSQVKKDETAISNVADFIVAVNACQIALVADALQGTWAIVDQLLVASGKPAAWGPQAAVNDYNACSIVSNNKIVHGIVSPGAVTNLSALIALLHG